MAKTEQVEESEKSYRIQPTYVKEIKKKDLLLVGEGGGMKVMKVEDMTSVKTGKHGPAKVIISMKEAFPKDKTKASSKQFSTAPGARVDRIEFEKIPYILDEFNENTGDLLAIPVVDADKEDFLELSKDDLSEETFKKLKELVSKKGANQDIAFDFIRSKLHPGIENLNLSNRNKGAPAG